MLEDAAPKLKRGEAVIVDVREKNEWDEEYVAGATHLSRGTIELDIEEKIPDTHVLIIAIAAAVAAPRLPRTVCKKRVTRMSVPWLAASKRGKRPDCRRPNNLPAVVPAAVSAADPDEVSRSSAAEDSGSDNISRPPPGSGRDRVSTWRAPRPR